MAITSIYADGSSTGRADKPGGWGFVIVKNDEVLCWSYGGDPKTTNNIQEVQGAINGLEAALIMNLKDEYCELVSDSQYALKMASGEYSPSKNLELVKELREKVALFSKLRYRWVKGHSKVRWNEVVDDLAKKGKEENT